MEKCWFLTHPRPRTGALLTQPFTAEPHVDVRPSKPWVQLYHSTVQLGEFVGDLCQLTQVLVFVSWELPHLL